MINTDDKKIIQSFFNKYEYLMSSALKEMLHEELDIFFDDFDY